MKKWNFGIVGAGLIGAFHAKAVSEIPDAQLTGVCDTDYARAKELASKYNCSAYDDVEKMCQVSDIDIITIATPSGLHLEPALVAAKYGKHAICEKPIEITLERIDRMIQAFQKSGTQLGCVFQSRFSEPVTLIKQAIIQGRFGTITYASAYVPWWREDSYFNSWRGTWKLDGGGALMNQSIHMIDLLCYLMPPVQTVKAIVKKLAHKQIETEDTSVAILEYVNNAVGVIYGTTAAYPGQFRRLEISGSRGSVIYVNESIAFWKFADETAEDEQIRKRFISDDGLGGASNPAAISHENHKRNFKAFIDAINKGGRFELEASEGRKAVELILRIYETAKK